MQDKLFLVVIALLIALQIMCMTFLMVQFIFSKFFWFLLPNAPIHELFGMDQCSIGRFDSTSWALDCCYVFPRFVFQ